MVGRTLDPQPVVPRAESLSCPNCGASIALQAHGWAVTVACATCGSVLDATDPQLRVLQQVERAMPVAPRIPLGTRGTWKGAPWDVIGFQMVTIVVEEIDYSWREYVCFNPYRGFLYLSEYDGHWNVIEKLKRLPVHESLDGRPAVRFDGRVYKHFQTASARTSMAIGEFPWELRVGDRVVARDFISPPFMLSAEAGDGETTWSQGTYTPHEVIQKAFGLTQSMRRPIGVFANQPNPHAGRPKQLFTRLAQFAMVLVVMLLGNMALASRAELLSQSYTFVHGTDETSAFVTEPFTVSGRPSTVSIDIRAELENDWVLFDLALINAETGQAREASRQVSYFTGRDSDGRWTEGSRTESVRIASVPAGRYFLRVHPEGGEAGTPSAAYSLRVRRDVPSYGFYALAFMALLLPAVGAMLPSLGFEQRRWTESQYGSATGTGTDDEESS